MVLFYANFYEVKYIDYEPSCYIGLGAKFLDNCEEVVKNADSVILFGCSGWKGERVKWSNLYQWNCFRFNNFIVDMESQQVSDLCEKYGVPFKSIRYIIDRDRGRVMPWGINHFWRKYQHRRMQLKFNKYLEGLK